MRYPSPPNSGTNVQSHNQVDVSVSVAAFAADAQCVKPLMGGWALCRDELGTHKLRGDSTRSGHESHLISTMYIYEDSASSKWGRRMVGGQRGCRDSKQ